MFHQTWDAVALDCFHDVEAEFKKTVGRLIIVQLSRYSALSSAVK